MRARVVGIWVSGLLASGFIGALVGHNLDVSGGDFAGAAGAVLAFVCVRLWVGDRARLDLPIRRFGADSQ